MESPSARLLGLFKHPIPARRESQIRDAVARYSLTESGFGGWADEKIKIAREAARLLNPKKTHPQHLTVSQTTLLEK